MKIRALDWFRSPVLQSHRIGETRRYSGFSTTVIYEEPDGTPCQASVEMADNGDLLFNPRHALGATVVKAKHVPTLLAALNRAVGPVATPDPKPE